MKNKLLLSILAALGLAGASSQAQTTTFVDVANLGDGVSVVSSSGTVKVDATVLTKNQRWTRDRVYILANNVIVPNGITLKIEAGTLIRAEQATVGQGVGAEAALTPADPGALVVARGGRLIANGTPDAPIIFTSIDDLNVPGGEATVPPAENLDKGSTSSSTSTVTNSSSVSREWTLTNSAATNITYISIINSTGSLATNTISNNASVTFTNYGFVTGTGTNAVTNFFRLSGTTTNWYATPTLTSTYTNLAARVTLRTNANTTILATNSQGRIGLYTVSGGTYVGPRSYSSTWSTDTNSAFAYDGCWGGIVICGYSTVVNGFSSGNNALTLTNQVPSVDPVTGALSGSQRGVQLVEGMAGFADYSFGGGDDVDETPDDSGVLRFISNRYGGYVIAADAELNSFSFYGVGRGTTLEFLEAWNNADDDYEFWGGDVDLRYAISAFCGDDGLDTDQGYLGTIQYFVQLQNNSVGTNGTSVSGRSTSNYGDSLTENDGPENNNSAVPYSTYTLANATLIGRGYGDWSRSGANPANNYNGGPFAGPNFKDNAGARTYNSLIMDNPHGAVLITDRESSPTNNAFSGSGNSSINRYAGTRSSGGFDGAGRAADLSTSDNTAPSGPDGLYNNTWFFRNGYADSTAVGVNGAYTNKADFGGAYAAGLPNASSTNMFPDSHDRSGRGASANNSVNRANTAAVQAALTNANTRNVFNTSPGVNVSPYHRLSLDLRVTNPTAKDLSNSALPSYRGLNTNATFVGAIRDNVWMRGWTLGDKLGIYQGSAIEPVVTLTANGSQQPVISFGTEVGVKYVVQYSTDNIKYTTLTTVTADALSEAVTDTGRTVGGSALFYRVIAL